MTNRIFNFSAGPATLPLEVLEKAQAEFLNFNNTGMSIMEMSHRSKPYEAVHNEAIATMKELLGLGDDYEVLFLQGGASSQFSMIPLNLLTEGKTADYILTGSFAEKAHKEAKLMSDAEALASKMQNAVIKIEAKTSSTGKIFGSVNAAMIAESLEKQGFNVDKRNITIKGQDTIKELGNYSINIKIYKNVKDNISIIILLPFFNYSIFS